MYRLLALVCLVAGLSIPTQATGRESAEGEYSRTPPQSQPRWKLEHFPATHVARLHYRELPLRRLLDLQKRNALPQLKAPQVGIARHAWSEASRPSLPPPAWVAAGRDTSVARLEIHSRDALALRVGLRIESLDDRVELRFAGSDAPARVVAVLRGDEIKRLVGDDGLFWTPSTDGETQLIEIARPAGVPPTAVHLQAPRLSHLIANSRNNFKIIEKIGESGSCNVDTSCRISELGQPFVDAKNAVAHMQFVREGATYICTGTLLADTAASTQSPYFYSANHCFSASDGPPSPSSMQQVANTLNTFWNYEATTCGSRVSTPQTQLSGGASYLYSDHETDAMLLRLNNPAPAGAFFAGWTAEPLAASSEVSAIHHPRGDAKKISAGRHVATDAKLHEVGWLSGTTESGSSGSALFTLGPGGYELRGGLYGGSAACSNSGSLTNAANRDVYSRFDVVFPQLRAHLAVEPIPLNGSEPLIPPDDASSASVSRPAPALLPDPSPRRSRTGQNRVQATTGGPVPASITRRTASPLR